MRAISFLGAVLSALLFFSPASYSAYYYYLDHTQAKAACEAEQTLTNHYYCKITVTTSIISNGGNSYIGHYSSWTPGNAQVNLHYFGWAGSAKPAAYTCPNMSGGQPYTYSPTTGLCSGTNSNPYSCTLLNGWYVANGGAFPAYVSGQGCQWDNDADGLLQYFDNCPNIYNYDQADLDSDGVGDECDSCNPDDVVLDYTHAGVSISSSIPASYCNGSCTLTLRLSECVNNMCVVTYRSSGPSCSSNNTPNFSSYIKKDSSSTGYMYEQDKSNHIELTNSISSFFARDDAQFEVINCQPVLPANHQSLSNYPNPSCSDLISPSILSAADLTNAIGSMLRRYSGATMEVQSDSLKAYAYYLPSVILPSSTDFGKDANSGDYVIKLPAYSRSKTFNYYEDPPYDYVHHPDPSTGNYYTQGNFYTIVVRGHGFSGSPSGGGGGSGGGTSSAALEEMAGHFNDDRGDIAQTFDSFSTDMLSKFDSLIDVFNGDDVPQNGDELYNLAPNLDNIQCTENSMHEYECTDIGHNAIAPGFFNQLLDVFTHGNENSCAVLTVNVGGTSQNILSQFCEKWEQYGRPILSFILYFLTLIGIGEMWLKSGSSR